jgi:hypothetical protein
MPSRKSNWWRPAGWLAVLALAAAGCGGDELNSPTAIKLKGLANYFLDYAASQGGKGPPNEQALKKHLRSFPADVLHANGVDPAAIDGLFVSDRDGEPFVVLYGTGIGRISGTSAPLVAHEKTGKNGKRLVVFANTKVELADDARLQELIAAKQ